MLCVQEGRHLRRPYVLMTVVAVLAFSITLPAHAETAPTAETANVSKLEPIIVTGSRLKRVDLEASLPLAVITRQQIEQSGEISIAGVLRDQVENSLGSFTPTSGTGAAQGAAQVNLRGLGAGRTLVLIDGRRMPNDPAFGGASQNINNIPMALVERIEILRGGASAIYGSDAIGGVINIISRQNYNGMQLSGQLDFPDGGVGDARTAALVGGLSNDKGNLYFALEHYDKDIIYSRDRDGVRDLSSGNGYPGTIFQYDASGNIIPQMDGMGHTFNSRPFTDCPTAGFGTSPDFPDSTAVSGVCRYLLGAVTALTAAVKRESLTVGGNYKLSHDITGFVRAMLIHAESFGRFSGAPVDSLVQGVNSPVANGNVGIRIAPDNPNNPNPGATLVLNYRPTFLGPRDTTVNDQLGQFVLGLRGTLDLSSFNDWEIAASVNNYQQNVTGSNNGLVRELQAAVDAGRFNPFAPDAVAADEFRYTTSSNNHFTARGIDGKIHYDLNLPGIKIPFVFGAEYRHDDLAVISDAQSSQAVSFAADGSVSGFRQSNVFGSTGGSAQGARSYGAAFGEAAVKIFNEALELGIALRFDEYSDVGKSLSPKLAVGYRPYNNLLLRGSLSRGFRAPDLNAMHGAPSKSTSSIIDRVGCREHPGDAVACNPNQRTVIMDSNPELSPERSRTFSTGVVWNAMPSLSLMADYYVVRIGDAITQLTPQTVFDNELACDGQGRKCDAHKEGYVVRDTNNGLLFAYSPAINAAIMKTRGIEFGASYYFGIENYGRYTLSADFARMLSYQRKDSALAPMLEHIDTLNSSNEIFPKLRSNAKLAWAQGRFNAVLGLNYISNVSDCDAPDKLAGSPACNKKFGDYLTVDLQFGISTPWQQNLTLGARNLFNEKPQVSQRLKSPAFPGIFYGLHDSDQRVIYLRLTQDF